ncbi:hypothetical protein PZA11_001611 [Diplocarpon coronariae]
MGILYLQDAHTSTEAWVFLNPVLGLAAGMLFAGMAIAVPAASKPINTAHVVAFFSFTRALGQCLGAAIGGTVFQNQIKDKLLQYPVLALAVNAYSQGAAGLVQVIKMIEGGVVKEHLMQAFADSLKVVRATMCGSAATALPSNVVMKGNDDGLDPGGQLEVYRTVCNSVKPMKSFPFLFDTSMIALISQLFSWDGTSREDQGAFARRNKVRM